jgi:hypothetical protein
LLKKIPAAGQHLSRGSGLNVNGFICPSDVKRQRAAGTGVMAVRMNRVLALMRHRILDVCACDLDEANL